MSRLVDLGGDLEALGVWQIRRDPPLAAIGESSQLATKVGIDRPV
jgi:hypothetical protein